MDYLTKEDLANSVYGIDQYHPGDPATKRISLRITSGTTGTPTMAVIRLANQIQKNRYFFGKVENMFFFLTKRSSFLKWTNDALRAEDTKKPLTFFIPLGMDEIESGEINALTTAFPPQSIFSVPTSFLLHALPRMSDSARAILSTSVRVIFTGGEISSQHEQKLLASAFPNAEIIDIYSATEFDLLTIGCAQLKKKYGEGARVFHCFDEEYRYEIKDPDEDGFGELVISSSELQRYRTGDTAQLHTEVCSCGLATTLIIAGRKDHDRLTAFGATFLAQEVMGAIAPFTEFLEDYLLEVDTTDSLPQRGSLTLYVVPKIPLHEHLKESLARALLSMQVTKTRRLLALVQEGLFSYPSIEAVQSIARKSPKMIRLRRKESK